MAAAKQQAARRTLYSMFFRGPILGSDLDEASPSTKAAAERKGESSPSAPKIGAGEKRKEKRDKGKKRKRDEVMEVEDRELETRIDNGVRKQVDELKETREASKSHDGEGNDKDIQEKKSTKRKRAEQREASAAEDKEAQNLRKLEKMERRRLRAEKRARKEERGKLKEEKKGEAIAEVDDGEGSQEKISDSVVAKVAEDMSVVRTDVDREKPKTRKTRDNNSSSSSKSKRKRRSRNLDPSSDL